MNPPSRRSSSFVWYCYYCCWILLLVPNNSSTATAFLTAKPSVTSSFTTSSLTRPTATATRRMMTKLQSKQFDLIVIGGGSAGLTAAKFAAQTLKKSCLLIEGAALGGDCTWTGCVPSKSLLASAKAAQIVRNHMITTSSSSTSTSAKWTDIQQRFRDIQQEIYEKDDSPQVLAKLNIQTQIGMATLTSARTVSVQGGNKDTTETPPPVLFEATQGIVLCTGATPKPANTLIPGLDSSIHYITYEDVWNLKELPKRLTVIGGGPIGCELAQAFCRLGSQVTVIASRCLLPREEPEVGTLLQQVFEAEGITVVTGRVASVVNNKDEDDDNAHTATTSNGDTVVGDVLLVSIGRVPNTKGLGLETVGIELGNGAGIKVNDKLETTCKGIYAAGDCTGDKQFTHYAGYQGAIAARNILLPLSDPGVLSDVPASTFTSPEVASIGYTEAQARKELGDKVVGVSKMNLDEVDRALCDGNRIGILKVLYHKRNGKILGATVMAPAAGELISEIAVARSAGMTFDALAKVIHPYPSYAMALQLMAADVYYEKTTQMLWLYNFLKRIGL